MNLLNQLTQVISKNQRIVYSCVLLIFIALSYVQHRPIFDLDIQGRHSWRQSATMWNIRNFVRHDSNILNPRQNSFNGGQDNLVRLEFPLMQWSIAMIQKYVTGESISVVRHLLFFLGIFSIIGIFFIVKRLTNSYPVATITAIFFQYSPLFYYYNINPLPDNLAHCFAIWYLYWIVRYIQDKSTKSILGAAICISLATLVKLPFIIYSWIPIYLFLKDIIIQRKITISNLKWAGFHLLFIIPTAIWYAWVMPTWGDSEVIHGVLKDGLFTEKNIEYFTYHWKTMFPKILMTHYSRPLFAIGLLVSLFYIKKYDWLIPLVLSTFAFLIFEINAIADLHDYYMLPFLPWIYIMIGIGTFFLWKKWDVLKLGIIVLLFYNVHHTPKVYDSYWSIENTFFNPDVLRNSEALKNAVPRDSLCIILNDPSAAIFSYRVDKRGHLFNNDHLPAGWVKDMILNHRVRYMYSDSKKINNDSAVHRYIEKEIMTAGSVKVYKLGLPPDFREDE